MGNFKVISETKNTQYGYDNTDVIVNGNYNTNTKDGVVTNISGSVYRKNSSGEQGEYIGNFNGQMRNDEMKYSLSEMSRADSNLVWTAIDDIETYILGENE